MIERTSSVGLHIPYVCLKISTSVACSGRWFNRDRKIISCVHNDLAASLFHLDRRDLIVGFSFDTSRVFDHTFPRHLEAWATAADRVTNTWYPPGQIRGSCTAEKIECLSGGRYRRVATWLAYGLKAIGLGHMSFPRPKKPTKPRLTTAVLPPRARIIFLAERLLINPLCDLGQDSGG